MASSKTWFLEPHYCPICGKEFYPTAKWVYKDISRKYCSYKCFRARPTDSNTSAKDLDVGCYFGDRKRKRIEQLELDGQTVVRVWDSVHDAAAYVNVTINSIYNAARKGIKCKKYLWRYVNENHKKGGSNE